MYTDYHIHTEFSDDSLERMETHIERAMELGMDELCFTDHVDYGIKPDWDEWDKPFEIHEGKYHILNVNYPEYFAKLLRMRRIYQGKMVIKAGLEFGVQSHTIPQYKKLIEQYGNQLDFVLLSIHEVDDTEFWTGDFQKGRTQEEYNMRYYEEMLAVVENFHDYSVLAHVDLISRYDKAGLYPFEKIKPILTKIFQTAIADGKGIELNTSSTHYQLKDTTPSRDILRLYRDLGGRIITIGSDAHNVKRLAEYVPESMQILRELGFTEFCTFEKMQPIVHKL